MQFNLLGKCMTVSKNLAQRFFIPKDRSAPLLLMWHSL